MSPLNITQPLGIWSIMATIRWCPIFPKWDSYPVNLHLKCKVHEFPDSSWPVCRFDLPNMQRPCQSQDEFSLPHLKLIGKRIDFLELDYQGHDETSISSISGRKVPNLQRNHSDCLKSSKTCIDSSRALNSPHNSTTISGLRCLTME